MKPTSDGKDTTDLAPLLTIAEVARILKSSQRTVRRLIQSGKLSAVKMGRCYRFRRHDVTEFVRSSLTTNAARQQGRLNNH
jgi:excisionase family DNA binding protein